MARSGDYIFNMAQLPPDYHLTLELSEACRNHDMEAIDNVLDKGSDNLFAGIMTSMKYNYIDGVKKFIVMGFNPKNWFNIWRYVGKYASPEVFNLLNMHYRPDYRDLYEAIGLYDNIKLLKHVLTTTEYRPNCCKRTLKIATEEKENYEMRDIIVNHLKHHGDDIKV